jgi:hypothetical protein
MRNEVPSIEDLQGIVEKLGVNLKDKEPSEWTRHQRDHSKRTSEQRNPKDECRLSSGPSEDSRETTPRSCTQTQRARLQRSLRFRIAGLTVRQH